MIKFNRFYTQFNILSSILIIASLILLIFKGLNWIRIKGGHPPIRLNMDED